MFDLQRFATAVTVTDFGFISQEDKQKLDGIAVNAQQNVIESVYVDGTAQAISSKQVTLDLSAYAKKSDVASGLTFKGTVASFAELPASGQASGDIYNVRATGGQDVNGNDVTAGDNVVWNGTGWEIMSSTVDLSGYVRKDGNKVLSTNDYTTAEKDKLAGIQAGAQQNVIETVQINGTSQTINNKVLTLDLSGYVQTNGSKQLSTEDFTTAEKTKLSSVTSGAEPNIIEAVKIDNVTQTVTNKTVELDLSGYVTAVQGKQLSTEDYTTAEKTKLTGISSGAQPNVIEGISVDGTLQSIDTETKVVTLDLSDYAKTADISASLVYKGVVDSYEDLPTAGLSAGHVYNIRTAGGQDASGADIHAGDSVAYNGTGWDILGGSIDLSGYVEKEAGKTLTSNDYTTTEKTKLQEIAAGAQVNVLEGITINGAVQTITNKVAALDLSGYVRKDGTKVLSTNDYTTAEKNKLAAISSGAEANVLEGVSINGTEQTITNKIAALDLSGYVQKDGSKVLSTNDYTTAEKTKLNGIATGAEVNVITSISIDGRTQSINTDTKVATLDLSGYVQVDGSKVLSTNDFDNTYKAKIDALPTDTLVTTATGDTRYLGISATAAAATADASGNTITTTYATKTELQAYIASVRVTSSGIVLVNGAGQDVCTIPVATSGE